MAGLEGGAAAPLPHRDPLRQGLPFGLWPQADRDALGRALAPGDLLADDGRACHWVPVSRRKVTGKYGRYLGWLARRGQLEPDRPVTARLNLDRVSAYLQERRDLVAYRTLLDDITVLRMFARAVYPDEEWRWLAGLETAIRQRGGRTRDKRPRLRGVAELVDLGETLMRPGSGEAGIRGRKSQMAYRDGLMIAFLALRPLRLRNFTSLTLGDRLQRQGSGWWIVLAAEETKNRRPLELPFPDPLVPALEHYLAQVRPWLLGASRHHPRGSTGEALWISLRGAPMSPASIYEQITLHTRHAFGVPLNPHLFRDCAATSLAIAAPQAVRAGGLVLGHAHYATTERHYNLARAIDAADRHQAVLASLRAPARQRGRR